MAEGTPNPGLAVGDRVGFGVEARRLHLRPDIGKRAELAGRRAVDQTPPLEVVGTGKVPARRLPRL